MLISGKMSGLGRVFWGRLEAGSAGTESRRDDGLQRDQASRQPIQSAFSNVQIQPTKVRTRKGYAKNGSGDAVGSNGSPQKILAATVPIRIAAIMPARRIQAANSLGTLMSRRAADHRAVPAAKEGTLPARVEAVPERMTASPIANTRKPAAIRSAPFLKYFNASREVATTRPTLSMHQAMARRFWLVTMVPTIPNTPPSARPIAARMFEGRFIASSICG